MDGYYFSTFRVRFLCVFFVKLYYCCRYGGRWVESVAVERTGHVSEDAHGP